MIFDHSILVLLLLLVLLYMFYMKYKYKRIANDRNWTVADNCNLIQLKCHFKDYKLNIFRWNTAASPTLVLYQTTVRDAGPI